MIDKHSQSRGYCRTLIRVAIDSYSHQAVPRLAHVSMTASLSTCQGLLCQDTVPNLLDNRIDQALRLVSNRRSTCKNELNYRQASQIRRAIRWIWNKPYRYGRTAQLEWKQDA